MDKRKYLLVLWTILWILSAVALVYLANNIDSAPQNVKVDYYKEGVIVDSHITTLEGNDMVYIDATQNFSAYTVEVV